MATYSRKEFLGMSALLAGGVGYARRTGASAQQTSVDGTSRPDLAVVNARVFTVDDARPRAEAFALKHGRFIAVGSTDDIRNLVGPGTEVIEAFRFADACARSRNTAKNLCYRQKRNRSYTQQTRLLFPVAGSYPKNKRKKLFSEIFVFRGDTRVLKLREERSEKIEREV